MAGRKEFNICWDRNFFRGPWYEEVWQKDTITTLIRYFCIGSELGRWKKLNQDRTQWRISVLQPLNFRILLLQSVEFCQKKEDTCHVNSAFHNIDHLQDFIVKILYIVIARDSEHRTRLGCRRANSLIKPVCA